MKMNSRRVGNDYERRVRREWMDLYKDMETARYASRKTDDNGIDFVNTGSIAIQCKRTKNKPNLKKTFDKMKTGLIKVIFWKNAKIHGRSGEFAIIPIEDFKKLMTDLDG